MKLKSLYLLTFLVFIKLSLCAQNLDYRVERIVNIVQKNEAVYDTLISNFEYSKEGKILKVIITLNGKLDKEEIYNYSSNIITVVDKTNNFLRSYTIDSIDRVVIYRIGMEKYTLTYAANNVSKMESMERIEGKDYLVTYVFKYSADLKQINRISYTSNNTSTTEKQGANDYFFFYNRDPKTLAMTTLKRIDWGKTTKYLPFNWRYIVQCSGDKITAINKIGTDNAISLGISYKYDEFGNITEESIKKPRISSGFNINKYIITYSKNKGNDYILWDMADWFYNKFCNQRTYCIRKTIIM